ncbi:MAG: acyl--CoA ligase [Hyphomonadaceae bacterium]|nr:acyl--CoA ligase [Hyphomonadaceae bacterium]
MSNMVPWAAQLCSLARRYGDRIAVSTPEGSMSYAELAASAAGVALRLRELGVAQGDLVGTFLSNGQAAVWASYGLMCSGAAEVAIDPGVSDEDLAHAVRLVGLGRVIAPRDAGPRFGRIGVVVAAVEDFAPEVNGDRLIELASVPGAAWGKILFTSGTTGRPKAIVHSHAGRWVSVALLRAHLPYLPGEGDRILLMTSFVHGASLLTYAFLECGASIELCAGVDVDLIGRLLESGQINALFAPPTVLAKIVGALHGKRFDHVRAIFTGTATLKPALYEAARAMFGPVIRVTYGMTEIVNPITVLPPAECDAWYRQEVADAAGICLGWPASGVEVCILDEDGGKVEGAAVGQIAVRARHMFAGAIGMDGFRRHPSDSFHVTGDQGYVDRRGRLFITGRSGDVIKTGGYKMFPEEVERLFGREVAVVGYPSDYWGEIVVAVTEGTSSVGEEVDWSRVTRHLRPRAFMHVDQFPRNAQGKIRRAALRELLRKQYRLTDGPHPVFTLVG